MYAIYLKWEFYALIGFVDLHCHALFRVDDGACNEQVMQNMLDMAYDDGTRFLCFTPHFKVYEFNEENEMYAQVERMNRRFSVALAYISEKHPDMQLFLGNEIMYHSDISESLSSGKCLFLGNSKYALIEFDPNTSEYEIENTVVKLLRTGVTPVIAHVERYSAFVKNISFATALKEHGALFQSNARAILKFRFGKSARFLKQALKKELIDIVASDGHNDSSFPPTLSKAFSFVSQKYGENYAKRLFHHTPLSLILN